MDGLITMVWYAYRSLEIVFGVLYTQVLWKRELEASSSVLLGLTVIS